MNEAQEAKLKKMEQANFPMTISRRGVDYLVELKEDKMRPDNYKIIVMRSQNLADQDYLTCKNYTLKELVKTLEKNLKIYTNNFGYIDYLSL